MENLEKAINQLSKTLGVAADRIYQVLMQQTHVVFIESLVVILFTLFLAPASIYFVRRMFFEKNRDGRTRYEEAFRNDTEIWCILASFTLATIVLIAFIASFFSVGNVIQYLVNPEYFALKEILSQIA